MFYPINPKKKHRARPLLPRVQSNQKLHDLYATMHISQMVLPDAFWAVWSQIFYNIIGKLRYLRYYEKI